MAGKSNRGRNRRGSHGSTSSAEATHAQPSGVAVKENACSPESSVVDANGAEPRLESKESENSDSSSQTKQGTDGLSYFNRCPSFFQSLFYSQVKFHLGSWISSHSGALFQMFLFGTSTFWPFRTCR